MPIAFSRMQIVERLRKTISDGVPIVAAESAAGLFAKCSELGGADLIIAFATAKSRLMGLPTGRMGDNNGLTLEMAPEILWAAKHTPVIGGVDGNDPFRMDQSRLLDRFLEAGFHGIILFPTVTMYDDYRAVRDQVGMGFEREVQLLRLAHERDIFTVVSVYPGHLEDAATLAGAGADVMIANAGGTRGGLVGYDYEKTMAAAAADAQALIEAAKSASSAIICLAHGGPFAAPKDTEYLYEHTDALGFIGGASIERIPVEKAVREVVEAFKNVRMRRGPRRTSQQ
jgi:predicted TIM-barrel enzyme